jgi:cytochrome c oxidase subunit 3
MLFAGLTSAYMVRQEKEVGAVCIAESFYRKYNPHCTQQHFFAVGIKLDQKNQLGNLKIGVLITFILGIGFVVFQYLAWTELVSQGIYFVGMVKDITTNFTYLPAGNETVKEAAETGNVAASFLYVITGLHVVHLLEESWRWQW